MNPVPQKYINRIGDFLLPDEKPEIAAFETRIWLIGSLIRPVLIVATNERILVTRRDIFRVSKHFKIIHYKNITNVHVRHGIIFSSIRFGVMAESEGHLWTHGLRYRDCVQLSTFVADKMRGYEQRTSKQKDKGRPRTSKEAYDGD